MSPSPELPSRDPSDVSLEGQGGLSAAEWRLVAAEVAYERAFGRSAPRPFGLNCQSGSLAAFLEAAVATGRADLDPWGSLPPGAVS